ncbi:MAG: PD40 domain-containing protein, partial [Gemmatimonadota bacterium]
NRGRTLLLPRLGGGTPRELNSEIITAWAPGGSSIVSWWPQARELVLTDVTSGDTTGTIALEMPHVWVYGVDWSPDGDRLAVSTEDEGTSILWTIALDDGEPTVVLEDSVTVMSPRWSPGGEVVYYLRGSEQQSMELRRVRVSPDGTADGDPERVLSALPVGSRHQSMPALSLSQDGSRLFYLRRTGYSNIWLAEVGGSAGNRTIQQRQLTTGTAQRSNPRFSPDGTEVVYVEAAASQSNVFVIPVEGGAPRQVTFQDNEVWSPAWSPDGSRIAYGATVRDAMRVWVVDRDGGTPSVFPNTRFSSGNRLAWAPLAEIVYQIPDDQNYHKLDPVTEAETPLIAEPLNGWQYNPRPSPDGSQVAFWWNRTDSLADGIWLASTNDGSAELSVAGFHPLNWNGRGNALFAMPGDPTGSPSADVFLAPLSGREPELFVTLPFRADSRHVDISPDGRRIVAAVEESQSDAWIVVNFDTNVGN